VKIKFWGTRGSIPVPGESTLKYGGNTPCVQIISGSGKSLILDAGTGINNLGNKIISDNQNTGINLLITHSHWDHIQGLTFFQPFYKEENSINIFAATNNNLPVEKILHYQFKEAFFPVGKEILKAKINLTRLKENATFNIDNFTVNTVSTHHASGTLGFKITIDGTTIVYLTDNEVYCNTADKPDIDLVREKNIELIRFCEEADFLIHDTMYDYDDYKNKEGWGHSSNLTATAFAAAAKVKNLIFFHYNPLYSDDKIDKFISDSIQLSKKYDLSLKIIPAQENKILTF